MKQIQTMNRKQETLRRRESLHSEMDWVVVAYLVVIAVALPLLSLQFLDSLTLMDREIQNHIWRGRALFWTRWSAVPLFAISSYAVARFGIQGIYLALFGIFVTLFVAFNFKADNIRSGTFDYLEESRWIWMTPVLIGWGVGTLLGFVRSRFAKSELKLQRPSLVWIWLILLGAAAYVAYKEAVLHPTTEWSEFAPTRHLSLLFIAFMLAAFLSVAEFKRRKL